MSVKTRCTILVWLLLCSKQSCEFYTLAGDTNTIRRAKSSPACTPHVDVQIQIEIGWLGVHPSSIRLWVSNVTSYFAIPVGGRDEDTTFQENRIRFANTQSFGFVYLAQHATQEWNCIFSLWCILHLIKYRYLSMASSQTPCVICSQS